MMLEAVDAMGISHDRNDDSSRDKRQLHLY